jgi:hypothetical protein
MTEAEEYSADGHKVCPGAKRIKIMGKTSGVFSFNLCHLGFTFGFQIYQLPSIYRLFGIIRFSSDETALISRFEPWSS